MPKLTEPQMRFLAKMPDEWAAMPAGDKRPMQPLERAGMIERRSTDVTPAKWEPTRIRQIRTEWRRSDAGRAAISRARGHSHE